MTEPLDTSTGPGRPREFDETEVVERAMEVFWREGYGGTSLNDLLEETGIGRASLYRTFGDKRGLFLRAIERYIDGSFAAVDQCLEGTDSPIAGLRALVEMWRKHAQASDFIGCLMFNSLSEFGATDEPELLERVSNGVSGIEQRLERALGRARDAGELAPDADLAQIRHTLLGAVCASMHFGRGGGRPEVVNGILDSALSTLE